MAGNVSWRTHGAGALLVTAMGISGSVLNAQPAARAGLSEFPDAQRALAAASIDERSALNSIVATLEHGEPRFYFSTAGLKGNEDTRVTLVRTLGPILARIVESSAFATLYTGVREDAARARGGTPPPDPAIARADAISELQLSILGMDERLAASGLSRRERSSIESSRETARTRMAALQRQARDPAVQESDRAQFAVATQAYETEHQAALAALEADLPSDVRVLARRRLEAFVSGCRDVNFRARTTTANGVTVFAAPEDEARPKIWKLCFRAGQRTVTEARRVATRWIGRLPRPPRAPN